MDTPHTGIVLKHEVAIDVPFKSFDRNFKDFKDKHKRECHAVYAINSDGKFRAEIKKNAIDDKEYILRISGWRNEGILQIQRIYVSAPQESIYFLVNRVEQQEARPIILYNFVIDFLDLMEAWAIDHKGVLYFEYIDYDMPVQDAYNIVKGQEKENHFNEEWLKDILDQLEIG
jgi:hypothetical protein